MEIMTRESAEKDIITVVWGNAESLNVKLYRANTLKLPEEFKILVSTVLGDADKVKFNSKYANALAQNIDTLCKLGNEGLGFYAEIRDFIPLPKPAEAFLGIIVNIIDTQEDFCSKLLPSTSLINTCIAQNPEIVKIVEKSGKLVFIYSTLIKGSTKGRIPIVFAEPLVGFIGVNRHTKALEIGRKLVETSTPSEKVLLNIQADPLYFARMITNRFKSSRRKNAREVINEFTVQTKDVLQMPIPEELIKKVGYDDKAADKIAAIIDDWIRAKGYVQPTGSSFSDLLIASWITENNLRESTN